MLVTIEMKVGETKELAKASSCFAYWQRSCCLSRNLTCRKLFIAFLQV
jgi:dimeric dUTPase (all-alpha-NTP-PPase superfamily)